ncbi:MAG: RadC family protein [Acutalibacteraceae bacterium]
MGDGVHDGHRERVKQEFLKNGFDESTPPHKIMEMLLFYSIPRKDTNEIAHELLNRFGSISGILDAPANQLTEIKGVSLNTVALLKLVISVARIYRTEKSEKQGRFNNLDEVCDYILSRYFGYTNEVFSVISFSGNGRILGFDILGEGNVSEVNVSTREIIETALNRQAVSVIIAHNHPSGTAVPSEEDIAVTKNIQSALSHINVKLLDHIVICGDDYVSMAQSRLFRKIFE